MVSERIVVGALHWAIAATLNARQRQSGFDIADDIEELWPLLSMKTRRNVREVVIKGIAFLNAQHADSGRWVRFVEACDALDRKGGLRA